MSIDKYLDREQTPTYWCGDLCREVWFDLTGVDLKAALQELLACNAVGRLRRRHVSAFRELPAPADPCLVVMQRPRSALHMGVFTGGRILHLHSRGVEYQTIELAKRSFKTLRFIQC